MGSRGDGNVHCCARERERVGESGVGVSMSERDLVVRLVGLYWNELGNSQTVSRGGLLMGRRCPG